MGHRQQLAFPADITEKSIKVPCDEKQGETIHAAAAQGSGLIMALPRSRLGGRHF
jgi:hypothetical protein